MEKPADKTMISLRFPASLLEKVDEEATARKRSRAFVITEKVEEHFNNQKPAARTRKKAQAK